ncbi:MAG: acyltransferase [Hyphomonadaceae bacterium]|nr:acyltransferase [Hyphomonadaceae bacterium]
MTATPVTSIDAASAERLDVLDGMRGIAALAVVAYHFFARWAEPQFEPTLYAHGDALATFLPLQLAGGVGVQLFFLISGFVIMMTLERATGLLDFTVRRAARLWPAMLVCATLSTLIINASGVAYVYENVARWQVTPVEYFSSLVFIPPDMTADALGIQQGDLPRWVEGVYWTLWCEVRFYALIALAFWLSPRGTFLWVWTGLQAASFGLELVTALTGQAPPGTWMLSLALQPDMLGWFTLGLVAWKWRSLGAHPALLALAAMAAASILIGPIFSLAPGEMGLSASAPRQLVMLAMIGVPFGLFLMRSRLLKPLTWPPVIAVGLASYPLYLFHERPGMTYLYWLNSAGIHPWISVALAIAIVIATALLLHRFVERPGKRLILGTFLGGATRLQDRFSALRMPEHRALDR